MTDERQAGLREAAYEAVAWSVIEVGPGSYQCRVCRADVTDVNAPHRADCVLDALRAALAVAQVPAQELDVERLKQAMITAGPIGGIHAIDFQQAFAVTHLSQHQLAIAYAEAVAAEYHALGVGSEEKP